MKNNYDNLGLVVALGKNMEIGYHNDLIWKIKEDLDYFKKITMNSYIIMGRNTYNSMPKNLKGRKYIVLSKDEKFILEDSKIVHRDINETLNFVKKNNNDDFWVVGGGTIYKIFLPFVTKMHITQIQDSFKNADTFFPEFDYDDWQKDSEDIKHTEDVSYKRMILVRKNY